MLAKAHTKTHMKPQHKYHHKRSHTIAKTKLSKCALLDSVSANLLSHCIVALKRGVPPPVRRVERGYQLPLPHLRTPQVGAGHPEPRHRQHRLSVQILRTTKQDMRGRVEYVWEKCRGRQRDNDISRGG